MNFEDAKKIFLSNITAFSPEMREATKIILDRLDKTEKNLIETPKELTSLKNIFLNKENDLIGEIWRDVIGYEGRYQVSNLGRVKGLLFPGGRILKQQLAWGKYYMVHLRKDDVTKSHSVHVLVAKAFIPNPQNKPCINHKDGNKQNNLVENLEWVTRSENTLHAYRIGLMKSGAKSTIAKLTDEQVKYIREHYIPKDKKFGAKAMSHLFNVSDSTIHHVISYKSYKNTR
ncbi:MAG: NUMOD4 motif-containing HNH endonuclease [Selenomonadaceae bacterium]|nr:NUMOD4 motif-containing HNH endonuclease [Selenomonadaceae bacterium]